MTNFFSDDLSDLLSAPAQGPKALPQDEQSIRIRASGIGEQPVAKAFKVTCAKCGGRGRFVSYAGRDCGPCFTCKGKGYKETKTAPAKLAAEREKAKVRKANRETENLDAFKRDFPNHLAWIERISQTPVTGQNRGFIEIVQNLPMKIMQFGDLSSGSMAMIERGMARDAERAAKRQEQDVQAVSRSSEIDASKIAEAFQRARAAGLEKIGMYFEGLCFVPARKDPDRLIYVKAAPAREAAYYGKIEGGRFFPSRDCTAEIQARIVLVAADPMAAAQAYGYATGRCCVCNLKLTNKVSVETGIGPICSGRMGWKPGGKKVMAGDF